MNLRPDQLLADVLGHTGPLNIRSRLVRGAAASFVLKAGFTGLTLLSSIILARVMGATEFGYFSYAVALVGLLAVPTSLGLPNLLIRYLAAYRARKEWGLMRGLLLRTNQAVVAASLLIGVLSLAILWPLRGSFPALQPTVFCISLLLLPLGTLNALRGASLRGLHHTVLGQLPEDLVRPALLVILVVGAWLLARPAGLDAVTAIVLQVIATAAAFAIGAWLLLTHIPPAARNAVPAFEGRAWFRTAIPLLALGGMQVINQRTDLMMLGIFTTPADVGIYQVVVRGADVVAFALLAVDRVIAPEFSRLYTQRDLARMQRIVTGSTRVVLLVTIPAVLVMVFFGRAILDAFFGSGFAAGAPALAILSAGQLANATMGSAGSLLNMTGHEADTARSIVISAVVNVALNLFLIPRFGIVGAATATALSIVVWNLLLGWWVYRRLGIVPSVFGSRATR